MTAWDESAPITKRLPRFGWQDGNAAVEAVVGAYDTVFMELYQTIQDFEKDFIDPDTCRADALDWLAQLMGFTEDYWDNSWAESIKRQLIKDAQQIVWRYKGTFYLLQYLIDLFGLNVRIELKGQWRVGVSKIGDPIGGALLDYSLVIGSDTDPGYARNSPEWRLIERLNRLYMPCWAAPQTLNGNYLRYHRWRVGRSAVGDPI